MKRFANTLIVLAAASASAGEPASWLPPPPEYLGSYEDWTEIPKEAFSEVSAASLPSAESRLASAAFVALAANSVKAITPSSFKCAPPAKTYLVRAAYMNRGTGAFSLHWAGAALIVTHNSLGSISPIRRSVLVACLARQPSQVFGTVGSDL
jgi:hypothetical protein